MNFRGGTNARGKPARGYRRLEGVHALMVGEEREKELTGRRKGCKF
jgi:hypothetical protein